MVRGMVHYKTKTEQLKQDKANLIVNYEVKYAERNNRNFLNNTYI